MAVAVVPISAFAAAAAAGEESEDDGGESFFFLLMVDFLPLFLVQSGHAYLEKRSQSCSVRPTHRTCFFVCWRVDKNTKTKTGEERGGGGSSGLKA